MKARAAKTGKSTVETEVIHLNHPGDNSILQPGYNTDDKCHQTAVTLASHLLQLNDQDSHNNNISDDDKTEVTSNSTTKNPTTTQDILQQDDFVEVVSKGSMKDLLLSKKNRFGIHFSRTSNNNEAGFHPDDIKFILKRILAQDPSAIFLPYSNNDKRAQKLSKLVSSPATNYHNLMDTVCVPWGRPSDKKCKNEFSFYIATDTISSNLRQLKEDDDMISFLKTASIWMTPHTLHQTSSKQVGFFLGKTPKHTSIPELLSRLRHAFGYTNQVKDAQAKDIPLQIKTLKIKVEDVTADALVLFAGTTNFSVIQSLVQRINFPIEIVPMTWKRSQNKEFKERLQLHNGLCNNSTAIKIDGIAEDLLLTLQGHLKIHTEKSVLDIARSTRTPTLVYIQCLQQNKDQIIAKCDAFFNDITKQYPATQIPLIINRTTASDSNSAFTKQQTSTNCWESKYKDLMTEFSPTSLTSAKQSTMIPRHINTQCKSYAEALRHKTIDQSLSSDQPSALSSPTASCIGTEKTQRELELESMVEGLQRKVQEKTELCEVLQEKLAEQAAEIANQSAQIQAQSEVNKLFTNEIESLKAAFAQLQHANGMTASPSRKKVDNKPTPQKQHQHTGIEMETDEDFSDCSNFPSSPVTTKDAILEDSTFESC
jgi:hypothetical protein